MENRIKIVRIRVRKENFYLFYATYYLYFSLKDFNINNMIYMCTFIIFNLFLYPEGLVNIQSVLIRNIYLNNY